MKNQIFIPVLLLFMISCNIDGNREQNFNYKETQTSFFKLRHDDWTKNQWIREPSNLKMIHSTFKKFGYHELLRHFYVDSTEFIINGIYIKKNIFELFDSLEETYTQDTIYSKYYRDFWQRRRNEKNDSIVYSIIQEINMVRHTKPLYASNKANDTLYDLLQIEYSSDTINKRKAMRHFETLKNYGFHQSAYNLLYERAAYTKIDWDRDSLLVTLDTTSNFIDAWFEDNTK